MTNATALPARFWDKVAKTPTCWTWTAALNTYGYGQFRLGKKFPLAHRLSFEEANGPIPAGMQVDHRCHNRACVNPAHLRLVNNKQNQENQSGVVSSNSSGVRGVHWESNRGKWVARVKHNGALIFLGRFEHLADAEAAALAKRNELFTHNDADRLKS